MGKEKNRERDRWVERKEEIQKIGKEYKERERKKRWKVRDRRGKKFTEKVIKKNKDRKRERNKGKRMNERERDRERKSDRAQKLTDRF